MAFSDFAVSTVLESVLVHTVLSLQEAALE
jgi:hypothetical protein